MQEHTLPGGHNLIVCAMNTDANPCPVGFPFTLDEGQLSTIYQGWEMLKYNEDLGTMHNGGTASVRNHAGAQIGLDSNALEHAHARLTLFRSASALPHRQPEGSRAAAASHPRF